MTKETGKGESSLHSANLYLELLKIIGRAAGQMSLYGAAHPSVAAAVEQAQTKLAQIFSETGESEIAFSVDGGHTLANGLIVFSVEKMPSSIRNLFTRFKLTSITFKPAADKNDIAAFCGLALVKPQGVSGEAAAYVAEKNIRGITVNESVYTKIKSGTTLKIDLSSAAAAGVALENKKSSLADALTGKSVEDSIAAIVGAMDISQDERRKIIELVLAQVRRELEARVKEATAKLQQENQEISEDKTRTENVISSSAEGVVVVDEGGHIMMMNAQAEGIFGKTLSELAGKALADIEPAQKMISLAQGAKKEDVQISGDGEAAELIKKSTAIIKDDSGKIVGSASVPTDVAKLRQVQQMQQDFIANVTHELRSPLTSLTAALDILKDSLKSKFQADDDRFFTMAQSNAKRLGLMISDILDFSKLQSGKLAVHPEDNDPAEIARDAADSMLPWAKSRGLNLVFSPSAGLPHVMADKNRTVQILVNLLSNAIKVTPAKGKIELSIGKERRTAGDYVIFSVKDTGPGIAPQDQSRIFERFEQIAAGEKAGGTGLGLPITKALVVMQNGQLELESAVGKGAEFKVCLPMSAEQTEIDVPLPAAEKPKKWWQALFGK